MSTRPEQPSITCCTACAKAPTTCHGWPRWLYAETRWWAAIACAAGSIRTDAGHTLGVVTVGPLGVLPDWQRRGIGRMLLDRTAALAAMEGHSALV